MAIARHRSPSISRSRPWPWAGALRAALAALAVAAAVAERPVAQARADGAAVARATVRSLVAAELEADARAAFAERDANGDGVVVPAEAPYLPAAAFARLDRDRDGRVSAAEGLPSEAERARSALEAERRLHLAFGQLDRNGDGVLQAAEAPPFAAVTGREVGYEGFMRGLQAMNQTPAAAIAPADAARPPVFMLPGFLMPASSFGVMRHTLAAAGYRQFRVLNRWPWFTDIPTYAAEGRALAERMRTRAGAERLVLLGHSLGGLVGRVMIQDLGYEPRVARYVSFGTPHHGTLVGTLAQWYALSAVQMTPGSPFLVALNAREGRPSPVRYTSMHAEFEEIVVPRASVTLAGAENPLMPGVFHTTMILMPSVCDATVEALAR